MKYAIGRGGFIKVIFYLALAVAIGFVGISFGKPYYRYNTLCSHTRDMLVSESDDVVAIKKKVLNDAEELNIPLSDENVDVSINASKVVKVRATWSEVVDFWGYYQKRLDFTMQTEG